MSRISKIITLLLLLISVGIARVIGNHHTDETIANNHQNSLRNEQDVYHTQTKLHFVSQQPNHKNIEQHLDHAPGDNRYMSVINATALTSNELSLNLSSVPKSEGPRYDSLNWTDLAIARIKQEKHKIIQRTTIIRQHPHSTKQVPKKINTTRQRPRLAKSVPKTIIPEHPKQKSIPMYPKQNDKSIKKEPMYASNLEINNWLAADYYKLEWQYISTLNSSQIIRCSIQRPFFNNKECVSCPLDQYFNFDRLKCVTVPSGRVFDPNIHKFVIAKPGFITNMAAPRLDFAGRSKQQVMDAYDAEIERSEKQVCPRETPFYDGIICIQCFEPYAVFNIETRRCTRCSDTQEYSNKSLGCFEVGADKDKWTLPRALSNIFTGV